MNNMMTIDGHQAVIQFDPELRMFRGEFLGLTGGADFYSDSVSGLEAEGKTSLRVFLEMCAERGIEPVRRYSGKFQVRVSESIHAQAVTAAAARGISLNQFMQEAIQQAINVEEDINKNAHPTEVDLPIAVGKKINFPISSALCTHLFLKLCMKNLERDISDIEGNVHAVLSGLPAKTWLYVSSFSNETVRVGGKPSSKSAKRRVSV